MKANIELIFSADMRGPASEARDYLKNSCDAQEIVNDGEGVFLQYMEGCFSPHTAVIFLSDLAVGDKAWQARIRALPGDTRFIPVGRILDPENRKPDVIPQHIGGLNFIKADENMCVNIRDSAVIPSDFYDTVSRVEADMVIWETSGRSDDFLMDGIRNIWSARRAIRRRSAYETGSDFGRRLQAMEVFLNLSWKNALNRLFVSGKNVIEKGVFIFLGTTVIIMIAVIHPVLKRALGAVYATQYGADYVSVPDTSLTYLDGLLYNPILPDTIKNRLLTKLQENLNLDWFNAPTGMYYKWPLNDAVLDENDRYLWTAGDNGQLVKWDCFNGTITERIQLSDAPLVALARCPERGGVAALDSRGNAWFCQFSDGSTRLFGDGFEPRDPYSTRIRISDDGSRLAVFEGGRIMLYQDGITHMLWENSAEKVLDLEFSGDQCIWVSWKKPVLSVNHAENLTVTDSIPFPVEIDDVCSCDIQNGRLLLADQNHQILTADLLHGCETMRTGLALPNPFLLSFISDKVIVYHDRELGTHVYDLEHQLDLGGVLGLYPVLDDISGSGTTVVGYYAGRYVTQDISTMLPQSKPDPQDVAAEFSAMSCTGNLNDPIREIAIRNKYLITLLVNADGGHHTILIDGTNKRSAGPVQSDPALLQGIPQDYRTILPEDLYFTGRPTVVGITGDGRFALIGTAGGCFAEIYVHNGGTMFCSQKTIPSHSPVVRILQTESGYLLEDELGCFWWARSGRGIAEENGIIDEVRKKYHLGWNDQIRDSISPTLFKKLDLTESPDNCGKDWE